MWRKVEVELKVFFIFSLKYAKYGYITADINHTYLNKKYRGYSSFRIMEEITCCVQSIKDYLNKERKF